MTVRRTDGPRCIEVRGARVNNLQNLSVDLPLGRFVALTGVSGSGKSSLAMGVLYAEGSRRYLDGLPTFTRRRISQETRPDVESVGYLPAALALRQRPPVPGPRSTVGTMTEVLAVLRLAMSRLGTHPCPNGHPVPASLQASVTELMTCPTCGATAALPSAESFAFNTLGACPTCEGLGITQQVDEATLVPDEDLSIDDGAVAPWRMLGRQHMSLIARELGVRTDVAYRELSEDERDIVLHGPEVTKHIVIQSGSGRPFPLNADYENATRSVQMMARSDRSTTGRKSADRFLVSQVCPTCQGSRLSPTARASTLGGRDLAEISALPLRDLDQLADDVIAGTPADLEKAAAQLTGDLTDAARPLLTLGLGYLSADRAGGSLSTGERQRISLASTAMRQTTGMLYVLDEPTVGLHPSAVVGLVDVLESLVASGNSLVVVDHDVGVLERAEQLVELGPDAGAGGGWLVAQDTPERIAADPASLIGPYLSGQARIVVRERRPPDPGLGTLAVAVTDLYNLHSVRAAFPAGRMSVVTGVSGAGKTALVLDSLVPALRARVDGRPLPGHVVSLDPAGITRTVLVDATPIGANARSTPATYSGAFDEIRRMFARTEEARRRDWDAGRFSYNTPAGRCPDCEGLGELALDLQYLPDLPIPCPTCKGRRYTDDTLQVRLGEHSIADVLALTVAEARGALSGSARLARILESVDDVGLGYLTLGEPTPQLSGGEAQRLRLATELRRGQRGTLFVFDEPTVGLHPRDVATLLGVFSELVRSGATVIVVEHDLDLIANADHIVDMGPGGGDEGGRVVAAGSVEDIRSSTASVIGGSLDRHLSRAVDAAHTPPDHEH
ncbi:MAG: excinuclease ABC subunit UvrA [Pseudonocardia sp.]|nr:excinuclease ABC subunit UvrA [Pseudonocardia sp.]